VVGQFHAALQDGGWLVVGHSEPMVEYYRDFMPRNFANAVFYQKQAHMAPMPVMPQHVAPPPVRRRNPPPQMEPRPRDLPTYEAVPVQNGDSMPEVKAEPAPDLFRQAQEAADREDWPTALDLLTTLEKQDRFQAHVYYLRALVQLQTNDLNAAVSSLRRAIYCDDRFALAHYTLGELYERRGAIKDARRYWQQAQAALSGADPAETLRYTDDMTVEMLDSLLTFRLKRLG
jgi:tetratricopeptide (TPR) repeat protein